MNMFSSRKTMNLFHEDRECTFTPKINKDYKPRKSTPTLKRIKEMVIVNFYRNFISFRGNILITGQERKISELGCIINRL